jgi:hypothetical protein
MLMDSELYTLLLGNNLSRMKKKTQGWQRGADIARTWQE